MLHTFPKLVATQSFLAVGELDDVQDFSLSHRQILPSRFLYDAVRVHHHGVQHLQRTFILGKQNTTIYMFAARTTFLFKKWLDPIVMVSLMWSP